MPFDANYKSNNNNNNNNNKQLGLDLQKGVYSSLTLKKKFRKHDQKVFYLHKSH